MIVCCTGLNIKIDKSAHIMVFRGGKLIMEKIKKIPHKALRYFPLKPRLQRLFMSSKTSVDMRWHKEKHLDEENVLRHPADSEEWKEFDKNHPWFAQEPRNIRLGLATDGFNPFGPIYDDVTAYSWSSSTKKGYSNASATQAKQAFYIDDPKLGENWQIVLKFQDRRLYDVLERETLETVSDELHITNDEVYQDMSLESNSIVCDTVDMLSQLHRDDVDSVILDANVIELEAQKEHEVPYNEENSDQEDETMIENISDQEENGGNIDTNDNEADTTSDGDDIGLLNLIIVRQLHVNSSSALCISCLKTVKVAVLSLQ
ncbi:hypothetical protein KY285_033032 [Solanum tuberosum]|nr:hypothetical protein KY285_033032 [Solanum tuberosum]